jgi:hypothetical protein
VEKGKITDRMNKDNPKRVNDNVADKLLIQAEQFNPKSVAGISHVDIWEEVKEEKKAEKPKKEAKK